ncbi:MULTISPECIES: GT-D fold domain-containing glycosyltransferase [Pantoea]|uniref:Glycosyltransferase, family 8 n=2 Tax=Pantoea TaxID=53335 RepID=A0A0U3TIK5_9GAMM|nr:MULTISPECIES: GT-D fold domain-containing glycosyltransferase [Pantoea]ALV92333.1 glycosyltransferase, family 8 [Pantoea vagans]KHJ69014.1 glycosyltransferase, family 8 [Pantoea rodasii]
MISAENFYQKLRFTFKLSHAALMFPAANARAKQYKVLSAEQTIDLLLSNDKLSLSRYGAGELEMTLFNSQSYQPWDERLSIRLKEILRRATQPNNPCLVCLPDALRGSDNIGFGSALFWFFHKAFFFRHYENLLKKEYQYGNTSVTGSYTLLKGQDQNPIFNKFKKLFKNKKILIVEGKHSHLEPGNELLADALEVKRITTLNRHAFSVYNDLYCSVLSHARDFDMVLMSLGPTATVLAYDLSQHGIRCIDMGQMEGEHDTMRLSSLNNLTYVDKNSDLVGHQEPDALYRSQVLLHVGLPVEAELSAPMLQQPLM